MLKRLLFIFAFLIAFTNYAQSGFEIKKNRNKVVIPFKLINNLVFIPIKLNGEELTFLLDTGVEETILFSVNDNSELTLNNVEVIKLKGLGNSDAINGYKSSKNEINIKQFVDSNHSLYIVLDQEFNFSSQVGIPVNGILGYHFFKNNLVKIDYSKRKIYVYKKGHKVYRQLLNTYKKDSLIIDFNKPYVFETITNKGVKKYSKLLIDSGNS
ncbi:aspartyl protease family protein [Flavobacterium sp.]